MYTLPDFVLKDYNRELSELSATVTAPSNIALVKYWGKRGQQLPTNPSISFTLDHCHTETKISLSPRVNDDTTFSFEFEFEKQPKPSFLPKIETFLSRIAEYVPFVKDYHLIIHSHNTFPHSSGVASSASAMCAMATAMCALESQLTESEFSEKHRYKTSFLARLGSGSACRSVWGGLVSWGVHPNITQSTDLYGTPFEMSVAHQQYHHYKDTILLVDRGNKTVSSTVGHNIMNQHLYKEVRTQQANTHITEMMEILRHGDLEAFINVVELEALTLHGLMMTSNPYFILMKPNTLSIIEKIWEYRRETKIPVCFTLDAGANVHLLYPEIYQEKVCQFIKEELSVFCQDGQYIDDQVGKGITILDQK